MLHGKGSIIHMLDATKYSGRFLLWTWELWECGGGAGVDWCFCGKEVYPGKCSPLWLIFKLQGRGSEGAHVRRIKGEYMYGILWFAVWFIITTIWSGIKDKNKSDVIGRYVFTFTVSLIGYYFMVIKCV